MFAVCVNYSERGYPCPSNLSNYGHTFMCSTLLCRTTWFSSESTYYCPTVRTLIPNWNIQDLMTLLRCKLEVYANSYIAMSVTPFPLSSNTIFLIRWNS